MWWRNPIRIAAVIALGALNAACFQPLYASLSVNGGTPLKRIHAAAQGRATPIMKRTSHVEIHVQSRKEKD